MACNGCGAKFYVSSRVCPTCKKTFCGKCIAKHPCAGHAQASGTDATPQVEQFIIGCALCHEAMSLDVDKVEGKHQCPKCGHEFDTASKEVIEKNRQEAPAHNWVVAKGNGQDIPLQGLDTIAKAMTDGCVTPSDLVVTAPLLPSVSVRLLAGAQKELRRLYDPIGVFADFWSWVLVAILPAICLALFGLTMQHPNPAIGLAWFGAIIAILLAAAGLILFTLLCMIPIVGWIIAGIVLIATAGSAILGYLGLAIVGGGGIWLLNLLHKVMRPLARGIGRMAGVEKGRISNWQQWMETVQQ